MSKTLSLGIVIAALGTGAAVAAIGSVNTRIKSIGDTIDQANSRIKNASLETIDGFVAQKKIVEDARGEVHKYQQRATELGKSLSEKRKSQTEATKALADYRAELAGQTSKATDEQKAKLKLLRDQLSGAEKDISKLSREFNTTRTKAKGLEDAFQMQVQVLGKLRDKLSEAGIATNKLDEHRRRLKATMAQEQAAVEKLTQRYNQLKAAQEAHTNNRADMNSRAGDVMAAYGVGRMMAAPVGAFVRQDDALNALQVAMMDKNGQVNSSYDALKRQAVELGNILPGTTADFAGTARALMEQGVSIESVLNGGLKSASYLSVVLRVPADQAGEMAAKLREAYKLSDGELSKMADSMQRAKFAFGMKPSDLMAASAYQAPMLNQLGITGIGNTNKMLAIQGMAAQVGLEGSSFGTNFSMMLSRLAKGPMMVEEAKKGMKAEAKEIMHTMGITFDFFDKKGNFAGLDHMVKELEKLKSIKEKLGDKAAMEVAEAMFGAEAGRPAMILAEAGADGFTAAQQRMADQADLQQRIKKTTESTRNTWDALTGSVENFAAAAAGPAVQAMHPLINGLNTLAGAMTNFAETHPTAAKWMGVIVGTVAASTVAVLALGTAMSFARFALSGAQLIPGMMRLASGAAWLGGVLKGPLLLGLRLAGQALLFIGRALLLNPIGLAVTVIAGAAYLIYRNWEPISAWFGKVWGKVKTVFSGAWEWFKGLPASFSKLGSDLINGLVNGITAKLASARDTIVGFGQNIKGWFAETLGIKSPSRVFMGFGGNIGEGAQLGMLGKLAAVKGAAKQLAGVAAASAMLAANPAAASGAVGTAGMNRSAAGIASSAGTVIHFSPTIHVGGGAEVRGQVNEAMQLSMRELEQMLRRLQADQQRRAF